MNDTPSPVHAPRWFDPRARGSGSWAFILNRLSALGLTFYLGLHLVVLNKLAQGAQAYDSFVQYTKLPLMKAGESILIAAVLFHGLNGLRLTIHALGMGIRHQKQWFGLVIILTLLITAMFVRHLIGE